MYRRSSSQRSLFEASLQLSNKKRRRLEKTWAPLFREYGLPMIHEELFRPLYCAEYGAPCKSVRLVIAVLLLQAMFDLTDAETQDRVDFDLRWHLALGLDPYADSDYVSQRTLQYFRVRLLAHPVLQHLFDDLLTQELALLGTATDQQRLDSTQIRSNFARRSRLGLFCETHRVLLRALRREAAPVLAMVPVSLRRRYLADDGTDSSYDDARAADSRRRIGVAARDAYRLREALRGVTLPPASATAYAILVRLVEEQCDLVSTPQAAAAGDADADLAPVPVTVKEANELTGAVLQTPHDPDVTYSGHKGPGYAVLLAETCAAENAVQLITHYAVERACDSDADRVVPTLTALQARDLRPTTLLGDTTFGSVENVVASAQQGVALLAPQPGSATPVTPTETGGVRETDFTVQLVPSQPPSTCPCEVEAIRTILRTPPADTPVALLELPAGACPACPRRAWCAHLPLATGTTMVLVELTENLPSRRRAVEQTDAFQDAYRRRAGIEGTNSELKRPHGLGVLRVRGKPRVELAVGFRVMACNLKRMLKQLGNTRRQGQNVSKLSDNAHMSTLFSFFAPVIAVNSFFREMCAMFLVCHAVV
jgi:hypothetical protein